MRHYEQAINGTTHLFQVADGDKIPAGARLVEAKQATKPANKAREVSNNKE